MCELKGDYVKCLPVEKHVTSYTIPSFCAFGKCVLTALRFIKIR